MKQCRDANVTHTFILPFQRSNNLLKIGSRSPPLTGPKEKTKAGDIDQMDCKMVVRRAMKATTASQPRSQPNKIPLSTKAEPPPEEEARS